MCIQHSAICGIKRIVIGSLLWLSVLGTGLAMAQPQGSAAKSVLKAMSDYMSSQQTIAITFDSDIEVITPQLEKIQFTNSGEMLLSRLDKLRAHRVGGYADVVLYFDGTTVSVFGKHINGYAQFEAPGTVDHLIETLRVGR
ncbi:MAG TPA: DUF2092 domain-containing protein [Candidatus Tectomicrobia bacterium]